MVIDADIDKVNGALPSVFELGFAFNIWSLGDETMARIGIAKDESSKPGFDLLRHIGFTRAEIEALRGKAP